MPDDAPRQITAKQRHMDAVARPAQSAPAARFRFSLRGLTALLALLLFILMAPEGVAEHSRNSVRFRSPHASLIVVDVRINGLGPFQFVLDTGATSSSVDPELRAMLQLEAGQHARLATWSDTTETQRVLVQDVSVGPISSGPLYVLVQPLTEFKAIASNLHGVLGQDVLLRSDYLIDNRSHRIEFDPDGSLLPTLRGDRVRLAPVRTRTGALEARLLSVMVQSEMSAAPLQLLLDSGADMVILQPGFDPMGSRSLGGKWMANDNGRLSPATSFRTTLSVGSERFSTDAWISRQGLVHLTVDGLLSTGCFDRLYISNSGSFVIFEPKLDKGRSRSSERD